jgi:hypothetical protein
MISACATENPHGGGIAWRRAGAVEWTKTNSPRDIFRIANNATGEIVIHLRIATVGGVKDELRHPFPVTPRSRLDQHGRCDAVLFQNGTWRGYKEALEHAAKDGHKAPQGAMSDTRAAAFLCSIYGRNFLNKLTPSRWVYFSAKETCTFGDWFKQEGIWFSNLNWQWQQNLDRSRAAQSDDDDCDDQPQPAHRHETKMDREIRELWDMNTSSNYWDIVNRNCKKAK